MSAPAPTVITGVVATHTGTSPSVIPYKHLKFILMDAPNDSNVKQVLASPPFLFFKTMQENKVSLNPYTKNQHPLQYRANPR